MHPQILLNLFLLFWMICIIIFIIEKICIAREKFKSKI